MLFRLDDFLSQGEASVAADDAACMEKSCSWVVPANVAKVNPQPLDQVNVYKPVLGKGKPSGERLSISDFHPVPLPMLPTTAEKAGELVAKLRRRGATPNCTFVAMYDAQLC